MLSVEVIKNWIALAAQLKSVKKQEMGARKMICGSILPKNKPGTQHTTVGEIELVASASASLAITKEDLMSVAEALTDQEKECVQWKPSIKKAEYDLLPADSILRTVVTMKLGAPSLKATNLEVK